MGGGMAKTTMVIVIAAIMILANGISAKKLVVGDDAGWSLPPLEEFYNNWAAKQIFAVGDILSFDFSTGSHNVAILTSEEAYAECDTTLDANAEIVTQGPYERNLTSSGQFYFICTIGIHCDQGLKFTASVSASPVSSPSPATAPSRVPGPSMAPSPAPGPFIAPSPGFL